MGEGAGCGARFFSGGDRVLPSTASTLPRAPEIVHFFFVPPLMLTVAVWLARLGPWGPSLAPASAPPLRAAAALPNAALAGFAAYVAYYTALDPGAGLAWGACVALPSWLAATAWASRPHAALEALAFHLASWAVQVGVGHALLEKRRPALVDALSQSLVLAGLFAWFELLFALGYRPALRAAVDAGVARDRRRRGAK